MVEAKNAAKVAGKDAGKVAGKDAGNVAGKNAGKVAGKHADKVADHKKSVLVKMAFGFKLRSTVLKWMREKF